MNPDRQFLIWLQGYLSAFHPVDFRKDNFVQIRDKLDQHLQQMEHKEKGKGYRDVRDG